MLYQEGQSQADLQNYTGAQSLYQKALTINPRDVHVLSDMGRVLFNLKNYTDAVQYLDKALKIDPSYAYSTLENKGLALYKLGEYPEALSTLNSATLNPDEHALFKQGVSSCDSRIPYA